MMTLPVICYLGIGSNLEDPAGQITSALQKLSAIPSTKMRRHSPWYASKAIGLDRHVDNNQPDFINGVIEIETTLEAHELLVALQNIETQQGRTRDVRWGARTLDIDILLYGNQQIHTPLLDIPHPRILERNFVLVPLADLDSTIPLSMLAHDSPKDSKNETIGSLLATLSRDGLRLINE